MDEMEMNGMDGMEEDVIVFEDEDGQEYEFIVVDYFLAKSAATDYAETLISTFDKIK